MYFDVPTDKQVPIERDAIVAPVIMEYDTHLKKVFSLSTD